MLAKEEKVLSPATAHRGMRPKEIYSSNVMVGFLTYVKDPDDDLHYINRLMTDEKYQGNEYEETALPILIEQLKYDGRNRRTCFTGRKMLRQRRSATVRDLLYAEKSRE